MKGSTAVKVFSNKPRQIHRWNIALICELIRRILENKFDCFIVIEGRRGCLTGDTIIKTPSGNKKISEMKDMNILYAYDFKNKKLTESFAKKINSGIKDVYEIKTEDNKIINATLEHIFYVERDKKIIELPLKEIKIGDKLICCKTID